MTDSLNTTGLPERPHGYDTVPVEAQDVSGTSTDQASYADSSASSLAPLEPEPQDPQRAGVLKRFLWVVLAGLATLSSIVLQFVALFAVSIVVLVVAMSAGASSQDALGSALGSVSLSMAFYELIAIVVYLIWWNAIRPKSFLHLHAQQAAPSSVRMIRIASLLLAGIGIQMMLSLILSVVLPLFPDLLKRYTEIMDSPVFSSMTPWAIAATAVAAPISEELLCRGVILEYFMRVVYGGRAKNEVVRTRVFVLANILTAAVFGLLHMNLVQGLYAFVLGVVLGFVAWYGGSVLWSIVLHLAINASSYVAEPFFTFVPLPLALVLPVIAAVLGMWIFFKRSSTAGRRACCFDV